MTWRAGQCAYLIMPTVSASPLEAHPFTIAGIPTILSDSAEERAARPTLKFVIRVREGFTKRLRDYAKRRSGGCTVTAFVDGPYGIPPDLRLKDTVVLIAGKCPIYIDRLFLTAIQVALEFPTLRHYYFTL